MVLGIKLKVSHMQGNHCTAELQFQPTNSSLVSKLGSGGSSISSQSGSMLQVFNALKCTSQIEVVPPIY